MPELISGLTPGPLQAGGEGLLFLLFILFSVVTALLERRKRKKQAEESRTASAAPAGPLTDEEDEETGSWPFPMGGDPFDLPKPKQRPERGPASESAGEATAKSEPAAPASRRTLIEQMEDDAKEEKRLQEEAALAEQKREEEAQRLQRMIFYCLYQVRVILKTLLGQFKQQNLWIF